MKVWFAAMALGLACSGKQTVSAGCSKDTDCRDPRVCERGVCVDPRGPIAVAPGAPDAAVAMTPVAGAPPFAMFGGDAKHTGRRGGPAPARAPKEQWKTAIGSVVAGSPTI